MGNIEYTSKQIKEFYSAHRKSWEEFYPSERWVFEKIFSESKNALDVLDVGCACGGLGQALFEKFAIDSYTGVDINQEAIQWAQGNAKLPCPHEFIAGDILKLPVQKKYPVVVSLGCADWNIETNKMINACWDKVLPGGHFVISLRLTNQESINDIQKSYQHIKFDDKSGDSEIAPYVAYRLSEAKEVFKNLKPSPELIGAYGYWGKPSPSAVTPFKELVFAVFYIKKAGNALKTSIQEEFQLPAEIF